MAGLPCDPGGGAAIHLQVAGEVGFAFADVGLVLLGVGAEDRACGRIENSSAGFDGVERSGETGGGAGEVEAHGSVRSDGPVLIALRIVRGGVLPQEGKETGGLADGKAVLRVAGATLRFGGPLAECAAVRSDGSVGGEDVTVTASQGENEAKCPPPSEST